MIVDWVSIIIPPIWGDGYEMRAVRGLLEASIDAAIPGFCSVFKDFENCKGRFPYREAVRDVSGVTIFYDCNVGSILIEVSGSGCSKIRNEASHLFDYFWLHKISRIDIAQDYGDIDPFDMVEESGYSRRIKSIGKFDSATGRTVYVGSKKSSLYARVYKYNPPSPRSNQARCEIVFRHERAEQVCDMLNSGETLRDVFSSGIGQLGMSSDVFNSSPGVKMETTQKSKKASNSINWLHRQVYPAIAKLMDEGVISFDEIVDGVMEARKRKK